MTNTKYMNEVEKIKKKHGRALKHLVLPTKPMAGRCRFPLLVIMSEKMLWFHLGKRDKTGALPMAGVGIRFEGPSNPNSVVLWKFTLRKGCVGTLQFSTSLAHILPDLYREK